LNHAHCCRSLCTVHERGGHTHGGHTWRMHTWRADTWRMHTWRAHMEDAHMEGTHGGCTHGGHTWRMHTWRAHMEGAHTHTSHFSAPVTSSIHSLHLFIACCHIWSECGVSQTSWNKAALVLLLVDMFTKQLLY
jgi:hypothetical protein